MTPGPLGTKNMYSSTRCTPKIRLHLDLSTLSVIINSINNSFRFVPNFELSWGNTYTAVSNIHPTRRITTFFSFFFFLVPFVIFALLFPFHPSCLLIVVTQIRGHIAGSPPPSRVRFYVHTTHPIDITMIPGTLAYSTMDTDCNSSATPRVEVDSLTFYILLIVIIVHKRNSMPPPCASCSSRGRARSIFSMAHEVSSRFNTGAECGNRILRSICVAS